MSMSNCQLFTWLSKRWKGYFRKPEVRPLSKTLEFTFEESRQWRGSHSWWANYSGERFQKSIADPKPFKDLCLKLCDFDSQKGWHCQVMENRSDLCLGRHCLKWFFQLNGDLRSPGRHNEDHHPGIENLSDDQILPILPAMDSDTLLRYQVKLI